MCLRVGGEKVIKLTLNNFLVDDFGAKTQKF